VGKDVPRLEGKGKRSERRKGTQRNGTKEKKSGQILGKRIKQEKAVRGLR